MEIQDITDDEFIKLLEEGQREFKNACIGSYQFTLRNKDLDNILFENTMIQLSFENCSLKKTVFKSCNLKTITFNKCNMTGASMDDCSLEAVEIRDCNLEKINLGINHAYGANLSGDYKRFRTDRGFKF